MDEISCGNCKWREFDEKYNDWACNNIESENYSCFTGYDDYCDCHEEKED